MSGSSHSGCARVSVCVHMDTGVQVAKKATESLEQSDIDAGNQAQILCIRTTYSYSLNHLSNPII